MHCGAAFKAAERRCFILTAKKIILIICCVLLLLPILALGMLSGEKFPEMHYSFENGFANDLSSSASLVSYGNMAYTETGAKGKALDLEDGYLNISDSSKFALSDEFTFSTWFKFNSLSSTCPMLLSRTSSSGDPYNGPFSITFSDNFEYLRTDLTFKMKDGSYSSYSFATGYVFTPERLMKGWHHIAVVFSKTYLSYYIDGALSSTEMLPEQLQNYESIANTNQPFSIGRGVGSNINAVLDEVYFYDYAADYDRVMEIYVDAKPKLANEIVLTEGYNTVWVNGVKYTAPANTIYNAEAHEVLIPAKAVLQHMNAYINWDENDGFGRADIYAGDNTISVWAYDTHSIVNGNYYKLKCYPTTENDALFIPASLLSDGLGAELEWNETFRQLTIRY